MTLANSGFKITGMMIDHSVLSKYSLFDGLEEEQIKTILALMENKVYEAGEDIIIEGEHNDRIHFILEGRESVIKDGVKLMELGAGDIFGEMEVLEVLPVEATIRTITPTKLVTLSIDALGEIYTSDLKTYSFILMNLARDIARKLRRLNDRVIKESPPVEWS